MMKRHGSRSRPLSFLVATLLAGSSATQSHGAVDVARFSAEHLPVLTVNARVQRQGVYGDGVFADRDVDLYAVTVDPKSLPLRRP